MSKRIIIAAGGTGGHVFPAIALANALQKQEPSAQILFVGSSHGPERAWIEAAGYDFRAVDVRFFKGTSLWQKIKRFFMLPRSARQCSAILREVKPSVVVGSGGYVSGPMLAMATMKRYPTAILEQNAIAGLTNRILGRFVDKIFVSFDVKYPFKASKLRFSGNPVRELAPSQTESSERSAGSLRIFVFGGSQGASSLNTGVPAALAKLAAEEQECVEVVHQCGRGKQEETIGSYAQCGCKSEVHEFIHDMGRYYTWADLLVCRAGATSIAEIQSLGKASVLVPFPYAAHQHQDKNADAMAAARASWKVSNDHIVEDLPAILRSCLQNPEILDDLAQSALALAKPQAAHDVAREVLEMAVT